MLFNSIPFLCFFYPLTLAGYYFISSYRRQMVAVMWLIACSIFFYSWWNVRYAALLIATMVFNYYLGTSLSRGTRYAKTILVFGIGVDIALLAYFKYMNFFISSVNSLLSTNWATLNIILPLGISFYTFQQIAYRVEAYEGKRKGDTFLNYCCCVTFFPHLIAGPIVRYASLMPQFSNPNTFKFQPRNMSIGLTLLTLGLVKKLLIADPCGARANPLFLLAASGEPISLWEAWVGILSFTFQIYFDFSGYCDMATGLARTFNIDLPVNFNSPYKARSIVEFWSRSHISLSNFFRDHLYQPLARAKARGGRSWLYFCVFSTMLISGIWHGAGWTFVAYGFLHGTYSVINYIFRHFAYPELVKPKSRLKEWVHSELAWAITFVALVVALVFFRSESILASVRILKAMLGLTEGISEFHTVAALKLGALLAFVKWAPNVYEYMGRSDFDFGRERTTIYPYPKWLQWTPSPVMAVIMSLLFCLVLYRFFDGPPNQFVYFQF